MRHRLGAKVIHQLRGAAIISCIVGFLLSRMRNGLEWRRRLRIFVEQVTVLLEIGNQFSARCFARSSS
jgi:hypothetical protein